MPSIVELVIRIASRDRPRTEATLQADVRQLLLDPRLRLGDEVLLESQVGEGRRIDVEVGSTVIEIKKATPSSSSPGKHSMTGTSRPSEGRSASSWPRVRSDARSSPP